MRALALGLLTTVAGAVAAQPAYPNKPIRLIVPYAPGGAAGSVSNLVSKKLSESWGQQVLIDNRPGGNTIIGSLAAAKSPPDGYTILLTSTSHVTLPSLQSNVPYDAIKDFAPVATIASGVVVLALNPGVPANTLQEFIALAMSKPGQLNYGSAGAGTTTHLASELFNLTTGVKTQHVPYKGSDGVLTDLVGGQIELAFQPAVGVIPYFNAGKLKVLAVSGRSRSPALPQVPTFIEAGVPDYEVRFWYGLLAPAGTPREIVDRLSSEITRILAMPDVKTLVAGQGLDPFVSTPEQFAELLKSDLAKYARVIKAANIRID
jgi:tripartite-type tricarboxylate transporter receptor subunit TctC